MTINTLHLTKRGWGWGRRCQNIVQTKNEYTLTLILILGAGCLPLGSKLKITISWVTRLGLISIVPIWFGPARSFWWVGGVKGGSGTQKIGFCALPSILRKGTTTHNYDLSYYRKVKHGLSLPQVGVWKVSWRCLEGFWNISGRCLEVQTQLNPFNILS